MLSKQVLLTSHALPFRSGRLQGPFLQEARPASPARENHVAPSSLHLSVSHPLKALGAASLVSLLPGLLAALTRHFKSLIR